MKRLKIKPTDELTPLHIRWSIRSDLPKMLEIENLRFNNPWNEKEFIECLRNRNVIGMVAAELATEEVAGYIIYELYKDRFEIVNLAVGPIKQGVGRALIAKLKVKLSQNRRKNIYANIVETNLDAQLFFKALGFRAIKIIKGQYAGDQTAYRFRYQMPSGDGNE